MKKRLQILSVLAVLMLAVSGCGVKAIDLTDDQEDMVAEYIAAAILKRDTGYETRLDYNPQVLEPVPTPGPTPLPLIPSEPAATAAPVSGETTDGDETQETSEVPEVLVDSMDALFDGVIGVKATGYKVVNSYDNDFYVVEPSKGKKLLMVSFDVTNLKNKKSTIAMQNLEVSYRVQVDGAEYAPEQTIVENDLQFFKADIKAGKSKSALLFFEIDTKQAKNVKITGTKGDLNVTMQVPQ